LNLQKFCAGFGAFVFAVLLEGWLSLLAFNLVIAQ
jgi:hypothetical protein